MDQLTPEQYYQQRIIDELGVSDEQNRIHASTFAHPEAGAKDYPIFSIGKKGIDILCYDLNGVIYGHQKSTNVIENLKITRVVPGTERLDKEGKKIKMEIPFGASAVPFFPPHLVKKYHDRLHGATAEIRDAAMGKTLVITEGYLKAFKGAMYGMDAVGLISSTTLKEKNKGKVYADIIELVRECKYENVILLHDGDATALSTNALQKEEDLAKRPNTFFAMVVSFFEGFKDMECDRYYAHILPDAGGKGLDDLLVHFKGREEEIVNDLLQLGSRPKYFYRENVRFSLNKVRNHFSLSNATDFYMHHQDEIDKYLRKENGETFVFNRSKWKWDAEKHEALLVIPGAAKDYLRVGDYYYKLITVSNKYNEKELLLIQRKKETIVEDHGKDFVKHIPKYEAFTNKPSHVNYQRVVDSCYNLYNPIDKEPAKGECETILMFLRHIFQDHYEVGLDYVQLLYQRPEEALPVIGLVSEENNTGKSTFVKLLASIFGENVAVIGNSEITGDFNAIYAGKLIIAIEETLIDKRNVIEKIKNLVTADKVIVNDKNVRQTKVDNFSKVIMLSNNERTFILANKNDQRYFVIKVKPFEKENPFLLQEMQEQIPAFLHFLNSRTMVHPKKIGRLWFPTSVYITEAFMKVVEANTASIEIDIRKAIGDAFFLFGDGDHPIDEFKMDNKRLREFIKDQSGVQYRQKEVARALERMKIEQTPFPTEFKHYYIHKTANGSGEQEEQVKTETLKGRFYSFKRADFVKAEEGEKVMQEVVEVKKEEEEVTEF